MSRARWGLVAVLHGAEILVVDDDANVRDATCFLLESLGARILTAADGAEALARLETASPDLVLSDLAMPRLDGAALIELLRRDPARASLPAIAVSALGSAHHAAPGFDAYLVKPFDEAGLWAALARVMLRHPSLFRRQRERLRGRATRQRLWAREVRKLADGLRLLSTPGRATRAGGP